jgi:hypothetical protein
VTAHWDGWSSSLACGCLTLASGVGAITASQLLTWSSRRSDNQGSAAGLPDHGDRTDDECPSIQTLVLQSTSSTSAPFTRPTWRRSLAGAAWSTTEHEHAARGTSSSFLCGSALRLGDPQLCLNPPPRYASGAAPVLALSATFRPPPPGEGGALVVGLRRHGEWLSVPEGVSPKASR